MDVTSYLLGKKKGGGGTINLQNKNVTITENTTTNISADAGYDGLGNVNVTTNVSGGGDLSDYFTPTISGAGSVSSGVGNMIKTIPSNTTIDGASCNYMFQNCIGLTSIPLLDTSNCTSFRSMFAGCTSLTEIPALDFSNGTLFINIFSQCTSLTTLPVFDLSNAEYINNMFNTSFISPLTNNSLNNLLASLLTATKYTGAKTLKVIGLTSAQATTCTTLSNWSACEAAGWTKGY